MGVSLRRHARVGKRVAPAHRNEAAGVRVGALFDEFAPMVLAPRLLAEGALVRAWDPVAPASARTLLRGVELADSLPAAVEDADAALVVTEWPEFHELVSRDVRQAMRTPLIVDGRNMLDPVAAQAAGFAYEGVGRSFAADPRHADTAPRALV